MSGFIQILNLLWISETVGLTDLHPVEMLQDQAQCILGDYVRNRYPRQPTRFGRLLLGKDFLWKSRLIFQKKSLFFYFQPFRF